jgi:hypothetical protein
VAFGLCDVNTIHSFDPFTHVYSFDEAMVPEVIKAICDAFARSNSRYLISFQNEAEIIKNCKCPVVLKTKIKNLLFFGKNDSRCCYIYEKQGWTEQNFIVPDSNLAPIIENMKRDKDSTLKFIESMRLEHQQNCEENKNGRKAKNRKLNQS